MQLDMMYIFMRDNNPDYPYKLSMYELLNLKILYDTIKHTIRLLKYDLEYSEEEEEKERVIDCIFKLERDIKPFHKLILEEEFGLKYER